MSAPAQLRIGRPADPLIAARNRSICRAYAARVPVREIAAAHTCTVAAVKAVTRDAIRSGLLGRRPRVQCMEPRTRHPRHEIIAERWVDGVRLLDIADELGMSATHLATYVAYYRRRYGEFPLRRRPGGRRSDKQGVTLYLSEDVRAIIAARPEGQRGAYVDSAVRAHSAQRRRLNLCQEVTRPAV